MVYDMLILCCDKNQYTKYIKTRFMLNIKTHKRGMSFVLVHTLDH